jgi:hypothetical protein
MKLRMYIAFLLLAVPLLLFTINLRILQLAMWLLGPKSIKFNRGVKSFLRSQWLKLYKLQQTLQHIISN